MKLIKKKIKDLRPSVYNPRIISEKSMSGLRESISRFGYIDPIIWNRKTNSVISGHQRLEALKVLGEKEIQVVEVNLDDKEEKALNITLNNPEIQGQFDSVKLQGLLGEIQDIPTFKELCLSDLFSSPNSNEITNIAEEAADRKAPAAEAEIGDEQTFLPEDHNPSKPEAVSVLILFSSQDDKEEFFSRIGREIVPRLSYREDLAPRIK